jgi:anaerobic selenocysteine-containing dehydrogenase
VVCINPLKERGLERFQHPQHPLEMLTNGDKPTNTAYFRPALGGDMAILRGMAKFLLQWEREAQKAGKRCSITTSSTNTRQRAGLPGRDRRHAWGADRRAVRPAPGGNRASGAHVRQRQERDHVLGDGHHPASPFGADHPGNRQPDAAARQHRPPGAGLCPVRGHSNVQGDRTMGINERPPVAFLDALERRFQFKVPRNGHNVVEAIHAMLEGRAKVFIGLGGNFAQATPDSPRTFEALSNCDLTVQISTKLNRSHLAHGKDALILPCLGRTDIDIQAEGPQAVTVEDSFSMVHASNGQLQPLSNQMRSEPAIIAGIAAATWAATRWTGTGWWPTTAASAT